MLKAVRLSTVKELKMKVEFYQNKIKEKTEGDKPKRYERLTKKMKLQ